MQRNNKEFLFQNLKILDGVGVKISKYLKKKNIEQIVDLLWNFPYSNTDRSNLVKINELEIGKICTIKIIPEKYNFPRIRNLPKKVIARDETGFIDLIFFNSYETYIKKILPINKTVIISGKINYYKKRYQIVNPAYITEEKNLDYVRQDIPKYSLTEGINEKIYRKIISQVLERLPSFDEWLDKEILDENNFDGWKNSLTFIHKNTKEKLDLNSNQYKRLVFDEILANSINLLLNKKKFKIKKKPKLFSLNLQNILLSKLKFELTADQKNVINEINSDLKSPFKMFRLLQGDVGSGKTIVAILAALNVVEAGYQAAFMAPTEILAKQHFNLFKSLSKEMSIKSELITGKTPIAIKKDIYKKIANGEINLIFGTHALFQSKTIFKKLGLAVIDEQHKFGVKQRREFSNKGGANCDIVLMSATPIPRTMMMSMYGDLDVSRIISKPSNRKNILTLGKVSSKIKEIYQLIQKKINTNEQVFWVCPLIEESKKIDHQSVKVRFDHLNKIFKNEVGIIHGAMSPEDKNTVLLNFLTKKIKVLVSTTVIEVGIDFPDATLIIIEDAHKFGLAQLHQLRGRVGRGDKESICILLFKNDLSENAKKRISILKESNDGFYIAERDLHLRGYGDLIGFKQSGEKIFKLADPNIHENLFKQNEQYIKLLEKKRDDLDKFNDLLKIFKKSEVLK